MEVLQEDDEPDGPPDIVAFLHLSDTRGTGGLSDHRAGWEDVEADEDPQDIQSLQAVQTFCRTASHHLHS